MKEDGLFRLVEQVLSLRRMEMKRENFVPAAGSKKKMRRRMRALLRAMPPEVQARASLEICRRAAALPSFREAKVVALFAPLPSEPDIHPLIEEAWARGKQVIFPLMLRVNEVPRLEWHRATSWEQLIVAGPFGIREPDPVHCPRIEAKDVDCLFVPGLAFDKRGGRLGRSGGYYDSALAEKSACAKSIGLMFACQEVPQVPREPRDQELDEILTEND